MTNANYFKFSEKYKPIRHKEPEYKTELKIKCDTITKPNFGLKFSSCPKIDVARKSNFFSKFEF